MLTLPSSTITGTWRSPFDTANIRAIACWSFWTLRYVNGTFLLAKSSRAAKV